MVLTRSPHRTESLTIHLRPTTRQTTQFGHRSAVRRLISTRTLERTLPNPAKPGFNQILHLRLQNRARQLSAFPACRMLIQPPTATLCIQRAPTNQSTTVTILMVEYN